MRPVAAVGQARGKRQNNQGQLMNPTTTWNRRLQTGNEACHAANRRAEADGQQEPMT
jgi:hypothetical protein